MIKLVASDIDGTQVPEGTTSIDPENSMRSSGKLKKKESFCRSHGRQYSSMRALDPVLTISFSFPETEPISCGRAKTLLHGNEPGRCAKSSSSMRTLPGLYFYGIYSDGSIMNSRTRILSGFQMEGYYHNQIHLVKRCDEGAEEIQKALPESRYRGDRGRCRGKVEGYLPGVPGRRVLDRFPVDPAADKGNALKELQNILGIKKEETMVFGDNFNDIGHVSAGRSELCRDQCR